MHSRLARRDGRPAGSLLNGVGKMRESNEIRREFLAFFEERDHEVVASSSLVPGNDPTLLFTNAGMVQFKDVFLGRETRRRPRAASSQRCVRAGGKHNDLDNVGYTARHHTFFEMLGNFSFGDYFKREAIAYAWEFLTGNAGLPPEKLWVTVFEEDEEAETIWLNEVGVSAERFRRVGAKDNFWAMGDTGPCGPCTEVFYDHGEAVSDKAFGAGGEDSDRFVEIWNLVFMQYERDETGETTPLPKPSVDTGMGLERIAAVLQGVHSNYDTDLFQGLIRRAADVTGTDALDSPSLKVIADHVRACSFLIADGVRPENEGRGYVLRRIIRRAARHGHRLGAREPFFHRLVEAVGEVMGEAYPELHDERIAAVLKKEEERFAETLESGLRILEKEVGAGKAIGGALAFKLYDTYGFPMDLTADVARERGWKLDVKGFDALMQQQRDRARDTHRFSMRDDDDVAVEGGGRFSGYETTHKPAVVRQIFVEGEPVERAQEATDAVVVLDDTPFYAESGGQVGDTGTLKGPGGEFEVADTRKQGDAHKHVGTVRHGRIQVGDEVDAAVDAARRARIVLNHSATHLLHAALKQVLGGHVTQRGSLVAEDRLRFDFSHDAPVGKDALREVEALVNAQIRANHEVTAEIMSKDDAQQRGAVALFGEKYGDEVRVLTMGDFSMELCGGTHVQRTGDVGTFKIISETGVAAGVRRIEALTGEGAERYLNVAAECLGALRDLLQVKEDELAGKVQQLIKENKQLRKQGLNEAAAEHAPDQDLAVQAQEVNGVHVLARQINGGGRQALRRTLDALKQQFDPAAIVLGAVEDGEVRLIAGVSKNLTDRVKAGDLVRFVAEQVGGKGGGKPAMAEAGGGDPAKLAAALDSVPDWVRAQT